MSANSIIKNTMLIGLSVIATNSTPPGRYFSSSGVVCQLTLPNLEPLTSTRFNNPERFSLEQLKTNKRKLEAIRKLRPNWNSYDGEAFDESLINEIEKIITDLDYQPNIFPTGRGTVQIEKYINEENLVEIEVSNSEIFAYQVKDGREIEKEISVDEINSLISDLYA